MSEGVFLEEGVGHAEDQLIKNKQRMAVSKLEKDEVKLRVLTTHDGNRLGKYWVKKDDETLDFEAQEEKRVELDKKNREIDRKYEDLERMEKEAKLREKENELVAREKEITSRLKAAKSKKIENDAMKIAKEEKREESLKIK